MAPEVVAEKPYSFSADIWSLGIVLVSMCVKGAPFTAKTMKELHAKIEKAKFNEIPAHYSSELKELITNCLVVMPNKRPSITQLLSKPILSKRMN